MSDEFIFITLAAVAKALIWAVAAVWIVYAIRPVIIAFAG